METTRDWTGGTLPALGMGCWAIGGPFTFDGAPVGWGDSDDDTSRATIAAAFEAGVRVFDTAQAYGTGHSESLLGEVLAARPEARIVTKVGLGIDADRRRITGLQTDPAEIRAGLEQSRRRLGRDLIDLVLLHPNELTVAEAAPILDTLADERAKGRLAAFGWSTDFPDKVRANADRPGFAAVEFAANVFFAADRMRDGIAGLDLVRLIRSPLAMGLLGGRITPQTQVRGADVRTRETDYNDWFTGGRMSPHYARRLEAVRELLTTGGRSLAQGALSWLWARHPGCLPVPGMRTPAHVADLAGALAHGPLDPGTMAGIERLIDRPPEGAPRPR